MRYISLHDPEVPSLRRVPNPSSQTAFGDLTGNECVDVKFFYRG